MKKKEVKLLKEKLAAAVKRVLIKNNATLTAKIEKKVNDLVSRIVKKTNNAQVAKKTAAGVKQ